MPLSIVKVIFLNVNDFNSCNKSKNTSFVSFSFSLSLLLSGKISQFGEIFTMRSS
jgi:hypothetical protein